MNVINTEARRFLMATNTTLETKTIVSKRADFRARLQPKNIRDCLDVLGPRDPKNLLFPLYQTNGVLFPYTPSISSGSTVEYDPTNFVHSNYNYNAYVRSNPKPISIAAEFTAQTSDEALYLLAVLHFFRSVTKSYFGINPYQKAGTPPPVLLFNYMGQYQFNNVPVVVKSFDYTYDATIDYVAVDTTSNEGYSSNIGVSLENAGGNGNGFTQVPTHISVKVELDTQYIPIQMRNNFNLDKFRSGNLITGGYI